jgi:hypothetical protein
MDSFNALLDRVLYYILLPATLFGAGGAMISSGRKNKSVKQSIFEVTCGAITTNAFSPLIQAYCPPEMHNTMYFLAGFGGYECVGRLHEAVVTALEKRIKKKIAGE